VRLPRRAPRAPRAATRGIATTRNLAVLIAAGALAFGAGLVAAGQGGGGNGQPQATAATPGRGPVPRTAPALPSCRALAGADGICRTSSSAVLVVTHGDNALTMGPVRTRALSVIRVLPTTAKGQAERRLRVVVALAIANVGAHPTAPPAIHLDGGLAPDPRASARPGALDLVAPLAPGATRTGTVSFELSGPAATRLRNRVRTDLGVTAPGDARHGVIHLTFG